VGRADPQGNEGVVSLQQGENFAFHGEKWGFVSIRPKGHDKKCVTTTLTKEGTTCFNPKKRHASRSNRRGFFPLQKEVLQTKRKKGYKKGGLGRNVKKGVARKKKTRSGEEGSGGEPLTTQGIGSDATVNHLSVSGKKIPGRESSMTIPNAVSL